MKYVAYYRVSTDKQGLRGLGMEAQAHIVSQYLKHRDGSNIVASFTEVESGRRSDRPELAKALQTARAFNATLIIAKLDRLARNATFLMTLFDSDLDVVFCDLPQLPAGPVGRFMIQQMAAVAELEAGLISERVKAALAEAKKRGKVLGGVRGPPTPRSQLRLMRRNSTVTSVEEANRKALDLFPIILSIYDSGVVFPSQIAKQMNQRGIPGPRGGIWRTDTIKTIIFRIESIPYARQKYRQALMRIRKTIPPAPIGVRTDSVKKRAKCVAEGTFDNECLWPA